MIAGYVGGKKAGGLKQAMVAAFLPAFALWTITLVFGPILGSIPIIGWMFGVVAGIGAFALGLLKMVPLLIGAAIGGLSTEP